MRPKKSSPKPKWKWQVTRTGTVTDALRRQITTGIYQRGEKLPTFDDLAGLFGVSRFTIQNVVNILKGEGFIRGVERGGLYVEDRPPNLHCIAIVYQHSPAAADWPRFCKLLQTASSSVIRRFEDLRFNNYYAVDRSVNSEGWQRLKEDVKERRVAGVLTLLDAMEIFADDVFKDSDLPLCSAFPPDHLLKVNSKVMVINSSYDQFVVKALARFKEHGVSKLAWMTIPPARYSLEFFRGQGFQIKPHWLIQLSRTPTNLPEIITALLLDLPKDLRPDALMLADENLAPGALEAIRSSGLKLGKDIHVVGHMNWPAQADQLDPRAHWLGYSVEEILEAAFTSFVGSPSKRTGRQLQMIPRFLDEC